MPYRVGAYLPRGTRLTEAARHNRAVKIAPSERAYKKRFHLSASKLVRRGASADASIGIPSLCDFVTTVHGYDNTHRDYFGSHLLISAAAVALQQGARKLRRGDVVELDFGPSRYRIADNNR
jgi:hypothetical protein